MGEWLVGIASLFVIGAIGFWVTVLGAAALVMVFEEKEQEVKAFTTLVIAILLLEWGGDLGFFSFVWNHSIQFAGYVAGYFSIGVAWSFVKWWFCLDDLREKIQRKAIIPGYFQENADGKREIDLEAYRSQIICWMIYWPWSMLWALFNDIIRRVFRFIYNRIQSVFRKIARWMLDDLLNSKPSEDSADRDVDDVLKRLLKE